MTDNDDRSEWEEERNSVSSGKYLDNIKNRGDIEKVSRCTSSSWNKWADEHSISTIEMSCECTNNNAGYKKLSLRRQRIEKKTYLHIREGKTISREITDPESAQTQYVSQSAVTKTFAVILFIVPLKYYSRLWVVVFFSVLWQDKQPRPLWHNPTVWAAVNSWRPAAGRKQEAKTPSPGKKKKNTKENNKKKVSHGYTTAVSEPVDSYLRGPVSPPRLLRL